jgi:aconitase A
MAKGEKPECYGSPCANMGAELGATTTVFPSDDETKRFLISQQGSLIGQN